ncbi:hypothetical protein M5D96_007205 [Drosophila gunungcola]|uniref:Uncharacterized protein n=1 Tax=Drosophila gunungcola TaxID=103775 RepID=A0A9P9YMS5_9MUSC|nr:hypothetical protein M5D96_007205 [Drosophila gunungcola]
MVYWLRYCVLHPAGEVLPLEEMLLGLCLRLRLLLVLQLQLVHLHPQFGTGVLVEGLVLLVQLIQLVQLVLLRPGSRGQLVRMLLDRRPNTVG